MTQLARRVTEPVVEPLYAKLAAFALAPDVLATVAGYPTLDHWQKQIMVTTSKRVAIVASRQAGKSLSTAMACARRALRRPHAKIILGAPSKEQSLMLLDTIRDILVKLECPFSRETQDRITLEHNGSTIQGIAGTPKFARGHHGIDLLVVDEAAYIGDDFYAAVLPIVAASDGDVFLLSSAGAQVGYFYESVIKPDVWEVIKITAPEVSRISAETLKFFQDTYPTHTFLAEFFCQFSASTNAVFAPSDIDAAMRHELPPLFPGRLFSDRFARQAAL